MNLASGFLANIAASQRRAMAAIPAEERARVSETARQRRENRASHELRRSLSEGEGVRIIAEIKRRSPSAGALRANVDAPALARLYQASGAAAVSVLTEPLHFGGSLDDLRTVAAAIPLPVLRKDFVVDIHQINEAAAAGADAVLLIVAMLEHEQLAALRLHAEDTLGMDALVEVHSETEMKVAQACGARLIGVNNRNLTTLQVDVDTSRALAKHADSGTMLVSESGLRSGREIRELRDLGYRGFLIGESLMRAEDSGAQLRALLAEAAHA